MSAPRHVWQLLGIPAGSDVAAVRAAYARQLKSFDPDEDPERFAELREARDRALADARARPDAAAPVATVAGGAIADDPPTPATREDARWSDESAAADALPSIDAGLHGRDCWRIAPPLVDSPTRDGMVTQVVAPHPADAPFRPPSPDRSDADAELRVVPIPATGGAFYRSPIAAASASAVVGDVMIGDGQALSARMAAHYDAILALLFPPGDAGQALLSDDEAVTLNAHVEALLADPRLQEIGFLAEAERWFAEVLADAVPRSDPAIPIVIDYFNWRAGRGRIDQHPAAAAVVQRADEIEFLAKVTAPGHPLNAAWRELSRPAAESSKLGRGWGLGKRVQELIVTVRRDYPRLEGYWDGYRVTIWENPEAGKFNWGWSVTGLYLAVVVFGVLLRTLIPNPNGAPGNVDPPPIVRNVDQAIDPVLASISNDSLTLERARKENPKLATLLESNFNIAREQGEDSDRFNRDMVELLARRIDQGIKTAPYALSADRVRLRVATARAMLPWGWAQCRDYIVTGQTLDRAMSDALVERNRSLRVRLLLEADGDPTRSDAPGTFNIPGEMIAKIAARAKLSDARTRKALHTYDNADEQDLKDQCLVGIALMEEALVRPRAEALTYLRYL